MFSFSEMSKSGLVVRMVVSKQGRTGSGTTQQEASPGEPRLLAGRCFPESKSAVIVTKRPCASWTEDNCRLGGETGEVKHPERL